MRWRGGGASFEPPGVRASEDRPPVFKAVLLWLLTGFLLPKEVSICFTFLMKLMFLMFFGFTVGFFGKGGASLEN